MRNTRQPARRSTRVTSRSRARFAANFCRQNAALPFGCVACFGHPCQKHPSTKTASRSLGNTKSGRTWKLRMPDSEFRMGICRRHPVIPCVRNTRSSASSVARFPRERMRAITADRLAFVKTSGIASTPTRSHSAASRVAARCRQIVHASTSRSRSAMSGVPAISFSKTTGRISWWRDSAATYATSFSRRAASLL